MLRYFSEPFLLSQKSTQTHCIAAKKRDTTALRLGKVHNLQSSWSWLHLVVALEHTWLHLVTLEHAHICPLLVTLAHFWLHLSNEHAHAKQPAPDHRNLFIASPSLLMCRRLYILTHADPCHACQLPHAPQEFGCLVA